MLIFTSMREMLQLAWVESSETQINLIKVLRRPVLPPNYHLYKSLYFGRTCVTKVENNNLLSFVPRYTIAILLLHYNYCLRV